MTVKIVTDSVSDLPEDIAEKLGISKVHLYVHFGTEAFRDNIEITGEELFQKIEEGDVFPTTSAGPPGDLATLYPKLLAEGAEGIISIHASSKLSAIYQGALQAKEMMGKDASKIEVIDSSVGAMLLGFLAISAARMANQGRGLAEVTDAVRENISRLHLLVIPDTIEYLYKGGRLPRPAYLILQKPMQHLNFRGCLTLKEGAISLAGTRLIRPRSKVSHIIKFVRSFPDVEMVALEYSSDKTGDTERTVEKIKKEIEKDVPELYICKLSAVICVHIGPGGIITSLKTKS